MKTTLVTFLLLGMRLMAFSQYDSSINTPPKKTSQPFSKSPRTSNSFGRPTFKHNTVIFTQPFKAIANYMLLGVETRATDHSTFRFSAGYCSNQSVTGSYDINNNYLVFQRSGFSVEAQFRRFIGQSAKVFQGIYFGPYIQFKHQQIEYEDWDPTWGRSLSRSSGSASCTVAGYLIGKYIPINEQFALDLWVGQGMYFSSGKYEVADRLMDGFHNAIRINGGIALGIGL